MMNRRKFLQYSSLLATASIVSVGSSGWVAKSWAQTPNRKKLIVVFLRGAVDGLSVVVPYREADYYSVRPGLAIPKPGETDGAIDLDGKFGLNPVLADLMPLWKDRSLAFVHACGSPNSTRSHFEAQYDWETGTPGEKSTPDGWMNRVLAALPKGTPTQAVNVGTTTPKILEGSMPVASLAPGRNPTQGAPIDRPELNAAFDRLYSGKDALSLAYQEGDAAREILMNELQAEMQQADAGAPQPDNFVRDARRMAQLMVSDASTQLGFMALGGWDTHVNQNGRLTRGLTSVGQGLAALAQALGDAYKDTAIVVLSEFGRTVAENGNGGTDHGYGNALWVMGGGVRGGQVLGKWPGLAESQRHEGRDLAITTDFRDAMSLVLTQHLNLPESGFASVFPGFNANPQFNLFA
jgi:uncharacterized protein (DUF1501 family)